MAKEAYQSILHPISANDAVANRLCVNSSVCFGTLAVLSRVVEHQDGHLVLSDEVLAQHSIWTESLHKWLATGAAREMRPSLAQEIEEAMDQIDEAFQAQQKKDKAEWLKFWVGRSEIVALSYLPKRVCCNSKCARRDTVKSKTGSSGIVSWVCSACSTVQEETVFTSQPDQRNFEETKERTTTAAKWHRQKYAHTEAYRTTSALLRRQRRSGPLSPDAALRHAAVVICAVLGERSKKDPLLMSTALNSTPISTSVSGLSCSDLLKETILECLKRDWAQRGRLDNVSIRSLNIFARALQLFSAAYKNKRAIRLAFLSAVAAMREFDQLTNGTGAHAFSGSCRLHLLDDFVDDKAYQFEIRRPLAAQLRWDESSGEWKKKAVRRIRTLRVKSYGNLLKEYCAFTNQDAKRIRILDIGNAVTRVLNEFHLVAPWTPVQEIANAKDIACYIYRIKARALVLQYWRQITVLLGAADCNSKDGEKARALFKEFDKRENVLVACSVVYSAFRDSSRISMYHPWPRRVLDAMEKLEADDTGTPNFIRTRREQYESLAEFSEVVPGLLRELECYESYREAKKRLGGAKLTEKDAHFPFHLRWFGVLFQVVGRRITDCCSKMPKIGAAVIQATQSPEAVLGLAPGYVARLEQRAKELNSRGTPTSSFQSVSGVAVAEAIASRVGGRKRKAVD